ncbi:hypothetical protein M433DRAFT_149440 [Acidomyces richmondensis BFW]|nr:MAG: hypothetical protein FE78DRAFT_89698 [Acidomyces sp. 'richmondensis']KYG49991.1 hypothetical protein M433DRAFT_149440 [Acidomyces richmondensis BFW]
MVQYGFILVPLYIYPLPGAWDLLFEAAKAYPNVTFQAIVNPDNGPGASECPDSSYINATAQLNTLANIQTLAYVHTAASWDCGPDADDICPCTQPLSALEANISKYQNWNVAGKCTSQDIHVDGIFFDEAPSDGNCTAYMSGATSFAKSTLTRGSTVLFNAGQAVNTTYWAIADYINIFEDTEAAYDSADIGSLDENGKYSSQSTMIIHSYTSGWSTMQQDVNTILSLQHDAMAGLYISNLDGYSNFPSNWTGFVAEVQTVVGANKAR